MSVLPTVKLIADANRILDNLPFLSDLDVLRACETIIRLDDGAEAARARKLRDDLERQAEQLHSLDFIRLRAAIDMLENVDSGARFLLLKSLCLANGVWTVPEDPDAYSPVWFEVGLFGVSAIAEQQDQLEVNWRIAARRILAEYNCEEVA
ncbi:MAG: hypothetical protein ACRBBS_09705 [Thalassovita sp.]